MIKSVIVQMFEELAGIRVIMESTGPDGSVLVTTQCGRRFLLKQVGPDLEVIECN